MNAAHEMDLNLIAAFDVLAQERSVTRAAERMGVTQSAMSHSLRRLRDLLKDPVFVRGRDGMALTPRGEALVTPLRGALLTVSRALAEPATFEPRTAKRQFRIASPDLFDLLALPRILERIQKDAPGVDIAFVPLDGRRIATQLATGDVDVAVIPQLENEEPSLSSAGILRRTLFHDRFVCLLRSGHPAIRAKRSRANALRLEVYTALSHVLVSPRGEGRGLFDEELAKQGLSRRIAVRVPYFFSALEIVQQSDLVLTAPAALARVAGGRRVAVVGAPIKAPRHAVNAVWHERFGNDAGHRWLRELVVDVSREVVPPQ